MMSSRHVFIHEVAPRDGLQIEPRCLATADKIALVDALSGTGVAKIEVSSFVSPKAIPNLSDAAEVFAGITRRDGVIYAALVPNLRGAIDAVAAGVDEINLVMSASETHNRANMRMSRATSLQAFQTIMAELGGKRPAVNGTVATAFGCPFEGDQSPDQVIAFVEQYLQLGFDSVTLADTTGMAHPRQVSSLVARVLRDFPACELTLHFHNTRGIGLANVVAALDVGAKRFDASLGGLGGCPFAPGATGNVCTEDVVHMLEAMDVRTGVDLAEILAISRRLPSLLGHETAGQVAKAGPRGELHRPPPHLTSAQ